MVESSAGDTAWWNQHHVPGKAAGYGICILFDVLTAVKQSILL